MNCKLNKLIFKQNVCEINIFDRYGDFKVTVIVDKQDYEKIKDYTLYMRGKYVSVRDGGNTLGYLHRIILGVPIGKETDHINRNTLDNRQCNLRICTRSQNNMNRPKQLNNKSGFKGVFWNKQLGKWIARININKRRILIGKFNDLRKAAVAYREAEIKYFGEFAYIK